ncbi:PRC-barrel domain-containing protein [Actinomadura madurae]|uniref:PRC-barrel domain-containing protein n=1 Tax=Actinomadura madurae TaxID=1993 RepID=UPI0020D2342D|nr:PRC-barrel domain-containing protein [Actinomadura madurae]MCQ0016933.1 PRC-barrel domain-containing protein [Actinomadura madurae]
METQTQVRELMGMSVTDTNGTKVGTIKQVYLNDDSGSPEWVTVHTGWFGMRESFVPLSGARKSKDALQVPYDKETIKGAPNVDADEHLSHAQIVDLYRHYGVRPPGGRRSGGETGTSEASGDRRMAGGESGEGKAAGAARHGRYFRDRYFRDRYFRGRYFRGRYFQDRGALPRPGARAVRRVPPGRPAWRAPPGWRCTPRRAGAGRPSSPRARRARASRPRARRPRASSRAAGRCRRSRRARAPRSR